MSVASKSAAKADEGPVDPLVAARHVAGDGCGQRSRTGQGSVVADAGLEEQQEQPLGRGVVVGIVGWVSPVVAGELIGVELADQRAARTRR
ncbi:MAG: hypothetical protein ACRDTG_10590 [Pseudonocardiaceae bacterium]